MSCLPVCAVRTSGITAGDSASGQNSCARPSVGEAVDVFDGQLGRAGAARKDRHATLEPDVGLGNTTQESLDKFVDALAGLAGEVRQPLFQCSVNGDGGISHVVMSHDEPPKLDARSAPPH